MAPLSAARGELIRLVANGLRRNGASRGFHGASRVAAAQNFTMPALSPTMMEGNIASWKVKAGDSFSAGDVLLEIETDKASMDVEAQDDGVMVKIMQPDGSKALKVGSRIAVIAEPGDDVQSIEIPPDNEGVKSRSNEAPPARPKDSEVQSEASKESKKEVVLETKTTSETVPGKAQKQTYPLYPSVSQLFHEHGLDKSDADKIPATGPNSRLLKGDVLAYLGDIKASYPLEQSKRLSSLGHLDLSNIKIAPPEQVTTPASQEIQPAVELEQDTEIAVSVSFKAVQEVQQRIQKVLGIDIPLATFITRAVDISNTDLPRPANASLSADELFDEVLGLNSVDASVFNGVFIPQITALPSTSKMPRRTPPRNPDLIDILAGTSPSSIASDPPPAKNNAVAGATTVFSVSVAKSQEKRARVFLERVKTILQVDPGRLVL